MEEETAVRSADALLLLFLRSTREAETEMLLTGLICEHADPIITSIVRSKLRASLRLSQGGEQNQDALEIAGDLRVLLISELRHIKADQSRRAIVDFHGYVAIKTYSACADYFRKKHPKRWQLKNTLRHCLKRDDQFALWEGKNGRSLCGFKRWSGQEAGSISLDPLLSSLAEAESSLPTALVNSVFEKSGCPLELEQLVVIAAEVWNMKDQPMESYNADTTIADALPDAQAGADTALDTHLHFQRLWEEVCGLPTLQRAALLLNLRDAGDGSVIAFLPYLGIASKEEIADLVGLPYEQLANLWNDLPLDDLTIARLLAITRQQVINLRKTARERLARRMKAGERNPPKSVSSW